MPPGPHLPTAVVVSEVTATPVLHRFSSSLATRLPFYYGYVMAAVAMVLQIATSPGQTFAMSAFKPSLQRDLGLTAGSISSAYAIGTLLAAVPLTLIGPLSDRIGLRRVTLAIVAGLAIACAAASQVTGWWTVLIAFMALRFLAQGSLSLLAGNSVSMWFRSKIGRVGAVMSLAMAAAFAFVPTSITNSIAVNGWRQTYLWIAVMVASIGLPMVLLLFRDRPEHLGQRIDGVGGMFGSAGVGGGDSGVSATLQENVSHAESLDFASAIRTPAFYVLAMTTTMWAMIGTAVVFHLYSICEIKGLAAEVPSRLFGVFGLSMLALQFCGGVAADFMRLNRLLALGMAMLSVGLAMAWWGTTASMIFGFGGLFGAGQGLLIAVTGAAWVQYYGPDHLGKIRGTVWCATVAGSGMGPLLLGLTRDRVGTFDPAIWAMAMTLGVLTPVALLAVKPTASSNPA